MPNQTSFILPPQELPLDEISHVFSLERALPLLGSALAQVRQ
jgi:hypothetical protein